MAKSRYKYFSKIPKGFTAKKLVEYYKIYQTYLLDHNLSDDSDGITVKSLIEFVEDHILSEFENGETN